MVGTPMVETKTSALPILEVICEHCHGEGGTNAYTYWEKCSCCNGAGYIPTEDGKRLLDLMRHNALEMVRESISRIID